ncbi:MAG: TRAP transporter large permease subunit, partial [Clostridiales Family XIII bacterium]|nr:TRAP transporter large permease subunit [Clostridiales Family XIII bacterium]
MSPEIVGLLAIVALVLLIMFRMWIGVAMGLVGLVGLIVLRGMDQAMLMAADVPFSNVNSYTLTVIPMFALMGMVISESSIGTDLFKACNAWLGSIRGGLASATVATSGLLGAICGSHMVGTVIMSKIALPEMERYQYDKTFGAATVCAGAPLSIIIPPSLPLIMYGIITEQSIGKLFMSGIIPGIVMIVVFIIIITIYCTKNPEKGPKGEKLSFVQKIKLSRGIIPVVVLFVVVLGGIYAGIFTTTESGAIGSVGAVIIALIYKSLNGKKFMLAIKETAMTIGMIFSLLLGTYIFIRFITYSRIPFAVSNFMVGLDAPMPVLMLALCAI